MVGSEGNGSTPDGGFNLGLVIVLTDVAVSVGMTQAGRDFIVKCLDLHASGQFGVVGLRDWLENQQNASDPAIDAGGLVLGIHQIPETLWVPQRADEDRIAIVTGRWESGLFATQRLTVVLFAADL